MGNEKKRCTAHKVSKLEYARRALAYGPESIHALPEKYVKETSGNLQSGDYTTPKENRSGQHAKNVFGRTNYGRRDRGRRNYLGWKNN